MQSIPGNNDTTGNAELIKDSSTEDFVTDVIEASKTVPVIVDFWAEWCGPCKQLGPALEKVVTEAGGTVRMVKIDVDKNKELAGQMGVQSIPAVFAFKDGQPVDGFMGALPESQIKEFVEKLVGPGASQPAGGDDIEAAKAAFEKGDFSTAAAAYVAVLQQDEENIEAIVGLATAYIEMGEIEQAEQTLQMVPADKADDPALKAIEAKLELLGKAAELDDTGVLSAKLEKDPANHEARFDLAIVLNAAGDRENAVHHLLEIVSRNNEWNEGAARKQLLQLFESWGPTDPMTADGRRKLSTILFA